MSYKTYATRGAMERDGWRFSDEFANCRQCSRKIEWAKSPKGKNIPVDPGTTTIHFDSCSERSAPQQPAQPSAPAPQPTPQSQGDRAAALKDAMEDLTASVRELTRVITRKRAGEEGGDANPFNL